MPITHQSFRASGQPPSPDERRRRCRAAPAQQVEPGDDEHRQRRPAEAAQLQAALAQQIGGRRRLDSLQRRPGDQRPDQHVADPERHGEHVEDDGRAGRAARRSPDQSGWTSGHDRQGQGEARIAERGGRRWPMKRKQMIRADHQQHLGAADQRARRAQQDAADRCARPAGRCRASQRGSRGSTRAQRHAATARRRRVVSSAFHFGRRRASGRAHAP